MNGEDNDVKNEQGVDNREDIDDVNQNLSDVINNNEDIGNDSKIVNEIEDNEIGRNDKKEKKDFSEETKLRVKVKQDLRKINNTAEFLSEDLQDIEWDEEEEDWGEDDDSDDENCEEEDWTLKENKEAGGISLKEGGRKRNLREDLDEEHLGAEDWDLKEVSGEEGDWDPEEDTEEEHQGAEDWELKEVNGEEGDWDSEGRRYVVNDDLQ